MRISPSIFKAYDIRGIYGKELDAATAYTLGRAFATLIRKRSRGQAVKIAVGGDMRLSTPELKTYFMNGAADIGVSVDDLGRVSTPTFYFACAFFGYAGGAQVTASHNPKEWNGFKFVGAKCSPIGKNSGIDEMRLMAERSALDPFVELEKKGPIGTQNNVLSRMVSEQRGALPYSGDLRIKHFTIAIDAGNGMGGEDMREFFKTMPCAVIWMNDAPDGTFPVHPADPMLEENTRDLRKVIVEKKCDLGIAIDGDGDRYFFFDEKGEVVPQEILRGIMAQEVLKDNPGAKIVYDVRPGKITTDLIKEAGGQAVLAPVGHSLIKEQMISEDAIFGAESSGHYFFKLPWGTFEAPTRLVERFLIYLSKENKLLSEIVAPHKKYANSGEINIKLESRDQGLALIETLKKEYAGGKQLVIDGLTIEFPDHWFNIRLSNTEPLIRFIVESPDRSTMEKKRDELIKRLSSVLH